MLVKLKKFIQQPTTGNTLFNFQKSYAKLQKLRHARCWEGSRTIFVYFKTNKRARKFSKELEMCIIAKVKKWVEALVNELCNYDSFDSLEYKLSHLLQADS